MPVREGNNDGFGYRTPVTAGSAKPQYTQDEADYNTLKTVQGLLADSLNGLYKDFNAFDILKLLESPTLSQAQQKLLVQIMGNQAAYDILAPLLDRINSAIQKADDTYKQRNNT